MVDDYKGAEELFITSGASIAPGQIYMEGTKPDQTDERASSYMSLKGPANAWKAIFALGMNTSNTRLMTGDRTLSEQLIYSGSMKSFIQQNAIDACLGYARSRTKRSSGVTEALAGLASMHDPTMMGLIIIMDFYIRHLWMIKSTDGDKLNYGPLCPMTDWTAGASPDDWESMGILTEIQSLMKYMKQLYSDGDFEAAQDGKGDSAITEDKAKTLHKLMQDTVTSLGKRMADRFHAWDAEVIPNQPDIYKHIMQFEATMGTTDGAGKLPKLFGGGFDWPDVVRDEVLAGQKSAIFNIASGVIRADMLTNMNALSAANILYDVDWLGIATNAIKNPGIRRAISAHLGAALCLSSAVPMRLFEAHLLKQVLDFPAIKKGFSSDRPMMHTIEFDKLYKMLDELDKIPVPAMLANTTGVFSPFNADTIWGSNTIHPTTQDLYKILTPGIKESDLEDVVYMERIEMTPNLVETLVANGTIDIPALMVKVGRFHDMMKSTEATVAGGSRFFKEFYDRLASTCGYKNWDTTPTRSSIEVIPRRDGSEIELRSGALTSGAKENRTLHDALRKASVDFADSYQSLGIVVPGLADDKKTRRTIIPVTQGKMLGQVPGANNVAFILNMRAALRRQLFLKRNKPRIETAVHDMLLHPEMYEPLDTITDAELAAIVNLDGIFVPNTPSEWSKRAGFTDVNFWAKYVHRDLTSGVKRWATLWKVNDKKSRKKRAYTFVVDDVEIHLEARCSRVWIPTYADGTEERIKVVPILRMWPNKVTLVGEDDGISKSTWSPFKTVMLMYPTPPSGDNMHPDLSIGDAFMSKMAYKMID